MILESIFLAAAIAAPKNANSEHASCVKYDPPEMVAATNETASELVFAAGDYRYRFSKQTGSLFSIEKNGSELLEKPVELDLFRGPIGGDMSPGRDDSAPIRQWGRAGLRQMRPVLKKLTGVTVEGKAVRFATIVDWRGARKEEIMRTGLCNPEIVDAGETDLDAPGYHVATEWRFFGDGTMAVDASFRQFGAPTEVARIGYRFVFKGGRTRVTYKARGPLDSYADRKLSAFVGKYAADSDTFIENHGRSCDSGNRMDAYAVRLESTGLTFAALYQPLAAIQVCPYSSTELILNTDPALLPAPTKTELGLYAAQAGIGSGNCGPKPETQYRLDPAKTYSFEFMVTPEKTLDKRTFYTPWDVNFDESKAGGYTLENPLKTVKGGDVTCANWQARRREILDLFAKEMYGQEPPRPKEWMVYPGDEKAVLGGNATVRLGKMRFCGETEYWKPSGGLPYVNPIEWMMVKPRNTKGRAPVVVFLNFRGNHEYLPDLVTSPTEGWVRNSTSLFIVDHAASELTRGKHTNPNDATYLPLAELIDRGYAVLTACYADVCPDPTFEDSNQEKTCFEAEGSIFRLWGPRDPSRGDNVTALGAWAWALSRGLDWAETDPDLDTSKAIVTGCSRLGKAALLAGARDDRFAVVAPVQTGGGGCPLLKRNFGENAKLMNAAFKHWYCGNFRKYSGNERAMPFDQHLLLAAVAPRKLLVSGFDEPMYDTKGEALAVEAARPVWAMFDRPGAIGYRCRGGRHGIALADWRAILDFAERPSDFD